MPTKQNRIIKTKITIRTVETVCKDDDFAILFGGGSVLSVLALVVIPPVVVETVVVEIVTFLVLLE